MEEVISYSANIFCTIDTGGPIDCQSTVQCLITKNAHRLVGFFVGECCIGPSISILPYPQKWWRRHGDESSSWWSSLTRNGNVCKSSINIDKYRPLMLVLCLDPFMLNASSSRKVFCFHDFFNDVLMCIKHVVLQIFSCFMRK